MADADTQWSSDVPVSMPVPAEPGPMVPMQGMAFSTNGMIHQITLADHARISTPDWAPTSGLREVVWEDVDVDAPSTSEEVF